MRNRVYSFKPKGRGYRVYATKTYHGRSASPSRSRRSSGLGTALIGLLVTGLVRGIFKKIR